MGPAASQTPGRDVSEASARGLRRMVTQQLTFRNGFHRERGHAPIHVRETGTGRPVAFVPTPAKTPSGRGIRAHLRRLIRRIRQHWPDTQITLRGDGHHARPEVMAWCEARDIDHIFGLPGNSVLRDDDVIAATADASAVVRAERGLVVYRTHCETLYAAKSRKVQRRVVARIEATTLGMDIRTIVTSLKGSTPERLHEFTYCDRGQAENLIKLHKTQLRSDRTCLAQARRPTSSVFDGLTRPHWGHGPVSLLHTAAHWLPWALRDAMPADPAMKKAEFATLRNRLIRLGARVIETVTRIRVALGQDRGA